MKASYHKYILNFKIPGGTSRGILTTKETWFIVVEEKNRWGIGECGILRTLSIDDRDDYEQKLKWTCNNIHLGKDKLLENLVEFPSIQFGVEQAFLSVESDDPFVLFPSQFTGETFININGLVWMGDELYMKNQIEEKLLKGFKCIKMKIGAIDFNTELKLLKSIRKDFSAREVEIRVDANGAFSPAEALEKLKILSELSLHSIEQPIKPRNYEIMAGLCKTSPLPIALDEELIGIFDVTEKKKLLQIINPQYIILKPSLIGGYKGAEEWIEIAERLNIKWWVTSALESNIGLNAISQWTYNLNTTMPQGLGTGSLFTNNFDSPIEVKKGKLIWQADKKWDINNIKKLLSIK
ncbi:o-succinylbenzoate synthase [Abyssalbus ytuae]|uniref:O-succinylbenzoate synthase n=1 Tax=Abyssalbus ytuae TaxID=2926907 RepID=A0A9E6ZMC2_9FLAO|nr:o-succinylbenzoate synthase [Abyssalbus ytuae]UOB17314.1 o-succinylbenzoate synthase [Abyssalbus ytuae]